LSDYFPEIFKYWKLINISMSLPKKINYLLIITAVTFIVIVLSSLDSITKIYNLYANFWVMDTVTFIQSLSSAIFAHLPFVNNIPGGSFFSVHASPFLYLLLPFYSIAPGFPILYVIQAVLLYAPAIPLYLITRKKLENDLNSFIIALSYLFLPMIFTGTFEVLSLFAGLFIFAYYFYLENKIVPFLIFFLLSLSTMEFSSVLGGMFGLVLIIEKLNKQNLKSIFIEKNFSTLRKYVLGFTLILISIIFFIADIQMISYFSLNTHSALGNLYGTNPLSSSSIFQGLTTSTQSKIGYIAQTNYPYFFLSFLDPIALMQLPWIFAIMISVFGGYWTYGLYYDSYTFPFVVLGAISGLSRIGKISMNSKTLTRIIAVLILIAMLISFIAAPQFTIPSPVSPNNLGLIQVTETIPKNASVFSDIDSYPIVSSQAWNTTTFGFPRNYTIFNAEEGPPYSLRGYGLYAASGNYLAYKRNFTAAPVLNNFYYESTPQVQSLPGTPFSYYMQIFLPKGDYNIYANLTQKSAPGIMLINPGFAVKQFIPVTEEAIQSFTLNKTIQADYIVINVQPNYGWYGFFAKITTSLNPYASPIASTAFGAYAYETDHIQLSGPFTLSANTTYYLWVGTSGYPGGISIPIAHGKGLYLMNTTTNAMEKANNSMQFSIVGKIPGYVPKPTFIMFNYISGNISVVKSIYLTGKGYNLTLNVRSNGNFSTISFLTNYAYGSFMINPLVIKTPGAKQPHDYYLENIPVTLTIAMLPAFALISLAFFDSGPLLEREKVTKIHRIIGYGIGALFLLFFIVFGLGYYNIVPSLYNVSIFAAFGYLITAFMLIYIFISYISREKQ
jgi:uncharacterized membrane protein